MGTITLNGSTSGQITVAAPAVAGTNTLTLPTITGTVDLTGPAFSAYVSSAQTVASGSDVKITFQSKYFDTATTFDNTTNYRFTPNVAGYYQISSCVTFTGNLSNETILFLYKNGSRFARMCDLNGSTYGVNGSILVYANGSTDYFEIYVKQNTGSNQTTNASGETSPYFTGCLVKAA
jgi:hypothetical protein